jgi:GAF domain-containing protein
MAISRNYKTWDNKSKPPVFFTSMIDKVKEARLLSVFRLMAERLVRDFDCDNCALLLMDGVRIRNLSFSRTTGMTIDRSYGCLPDDISRFASVKKGTPVIIIQDRLARYFDSAQAAPGSYILSPIFIGDYVRGAIFIGSSGNQSFLSRDRAFLQALASKMCLLVLDTIQPS